MAELARLRTATPSAASSDPYSNQPVPDIPPYPAVVAVALAVATAASHFGGVPFSTALVLVGSGVVVAWFASYKRPAAKQQPANLVQKATRWYFARVVRLAVGSAFISSAAVLLLQFLQ